MTGKKYDDTNRGALFKNERKSAETHSDYNGQINVGGHDYWLNAWIKKSKDGKTYMSLSVKQKDGKPAPREPENRQGAGLSQPVKQSINQDMDDEIPFACEWR